LADQLVSQVGTIGTLRAENDALKAAQQPRTASTALDPPEPPPRPNPMPWPLPPRPNVRALAPWLLGLLAIVVVVGLLAWSQ
jgi:hypothetical protein